MPTGPQEGRLAPVRYPTLNPTVVALNKDALWWICVSCACTPHRRDDPDYLLRPPVLGRGSMRQRGETTTRGASSLRALLSTCGCGLMRRTLRSQLFLHDPFG